MRRMTHVIIANCEQIATNMKLVLVSYKSIYTRVQAEEKEEEDYDAAGKGIHSWTHGLACHGRYHYSRFHSK